MKDGAKIDLGTVEAQLRTRRAELVQLNEAHEDDRRPVELDQTRAGRLSRMDALQSQAMAVEVERRRDLELTRIDAALERLKDGEYGYCITCGEPIALKRLELDPATPVCIDCATQSG
ncbi:MAG TPA: TraR/DksA C4-type zinc finger protein [Geminicoccaceae bacterium]